MDLKTWAMVFVAIKIIKSVLPKYSWHSLFKEQTGKILYLNIKSHIDFNLVHRQWNSFGSYVCWMSSSRCISSARYLVKSLNASAKIRCPFPSTKIHGRFLIQSNTFPKGLFKFHTRCIFTMNATVAQYTISANSVLLLQ